MATFKAKLNQIYGGSDGQPKYSTFAGRPGEEDGQAQLGTFYCKLLLPNGTLIVSDVKRRKRDAEHDAAHKALVQIGSPEASHPVKTKDQVWTDLKLRIETAFTNECVLNYKPLMEHFRAAIVHKRRIHAPVPASVLASLDTKIASLCKALDKLSESSPARALQLVCLAAQDSSFLHCDENSWISRLEPFPAYVENGLSKQLEKQNLQLFDAVYIPATSSSMVSATQISLTSKDYYMDVLANTLGLKDAGNVLISRSITRTTYGTRVFWGLTTETDIKYANINIRASTITGHPVYGDAVLAAVGSTWKSEGMLCCDNVSLSCYYRLILGKFPTGCFKLARGAVLTAELSPSYSSKTRWRGPTPRSLLNEFCHQNHLLAPAVHFYPVSEGSDNTGDYTATVEGQEEPIDLNSAKGPFMCKLRVSSGDTQEFVSERSYRNCNDAVQSACLQALLHFDGSVADSLQDCATEPLQQHIDMSQKKLPEFDIVGEAAKAGDKPPIGCMVHVSYSARIKGADINETVEVHDDFEFELGSGAVISVLDLCVTNMCVGQTARFSAPAPSIDLILAGQEFSASSIQKIVRGAWSLEYTVSLLKYVEAPEARMESAVFSPPLSKQRIDFALQLFQRSQASSLVDLGCGSGSFLEAILEQPHCLKHIVGVDISQKSLTRCSKSLQTRLSKLPGDSSVLKSVTLYEGSIAEPDTRLKNTDIATCLEVVEHMDDEPLSKFGRSVLGVMSPKILIVSTPNIEYNPILHRMQHEYNKVDSGSPEEDDRKEDTTAPVKLRNDDHRFEWTRAEFSDWAGKLASTYGYRVEFSGVGGVQGQEPGFASQIATFTRLTTSETLLKDDDASAAHAIESATPYTQLWRWGS